MIRFGQARRAVTLGIALFTPYLRASYEALAMTPRSPAPPTATGLPRSEGSSSTSTEAKNASRSTCRIGASSTEGPSKGEFNTAKRLTVRHAHRSTGLLGSFVHHGTDRLSVVAGLRGVRKDGLDFDVDRRRDVHHHVGIVRPAQQQHAHLMGSTLFGKVQRHRRRGGNG